MLLDDDVVLLGDVVVGVVGDDTYFKVVLMPCHLLSVTSSPSCCCGVVLGRIGLNRVCVSSVAV